MAIRKLKEVHAFSHPAAKLAPLDDVAIDRETEELLLKETLFSSLAAEAAEDDGSD